MVKQKTFLERKSDENINDTLTVSQKYDGIEMRTSTGRNGYLRFTKAQIRSMIKFLESLL